jgi:hypothetical protein
MRKDESAEAVVLCWPTTFPLPSHLVTFTFGAGFCCRGLGGAGAGPLLIFGYYVSPLLSEQKISSDTGDTPVSEYRYVYVSIYHARYKYEGDLCVCSQRHIEEAAACLMPYV